MKKGSDFEALIAGYLTRGGFDLIQKTEPCAHIIKPLGKGQFVVRFDSGGILDFCGCHDGDYYEFDAKDIKGNRLTFSRHFKPSQLHRIKALYEDGARVGVIVRFRGNTANDDLVLGIHGAVLVGALVAGETGLSGSKIAATDGAVRIRYGHLGDMKRYIELLNFS